MNTSLQLFLSALLLGPFSLIAQYDVSTFTADYSELENPLTLNIDQGWDDPLFNVPLGFNFTAGGVTANIIEQQGLGAGFLLGSFENGAYIGTFDDLIDASLGSGSPSTITYVVEGSSGNRICKVQYKDCGFFSDENLGANLVNFQIWLYEIDNAVEFRHGSNTVTDLSVYEGLGGSQIAILTGLTDDGETFNTGTVLSGDPTNPTVNSSNSTAELEFLALNGTPADGRVYRFTPQSLSIENTEEAEYSVFPSPADDFIQIDGEVKSGDSFRITDISGRVVSQGVFMENGHIDVSELTAGIYLISFVNYRATGKFLKK